MEFENQIHQMNDRQLLEFTARQTYDVCLLAADNKKRIDTLKRRDRKVFSVTGGLGAFFGAAIAVIADFFIRR
jgi:hypothetical protein